MEPLQPLAGQCSARGCADIDLSVLDSSSRNLLMNAFLQPSFYKNSVRVLALAFSLECFWHAQAQPYIVSTVPEYAATDVSPAPPAVFTFSEAMSPGATAV